MSSRIFQSVIIQMRDATSKSIGVISTEGSVIASSELSLIGTEIKPVHPNNDTSADIITTGGGWTFKPLYALTGNDYYVFAQGEDQLARTVCIMAAVAISEAGMHFEENNDKRSFVKNIIMENILPGDVVSRAKELRFSAENVRGVIVIRHGIAADTSVAELLQDMYSDKQNDFIFSITDQEVVLIKELPALNPSKALRDMAEKIEAKIEQDIGLKPYIGIGTPANDLRELSDRYKEAHIAIDIGKVFEVGESISCYESLGIGRLIYHLPKTLCDIFLAEVFKRKPIESLDQETLLTIDKFFENNLNVSETSRKLFVHRNTLVYRLEKIKKITGLDLRKFDHAIIFRVALMVKKYLISQETKHQ